VNDLGDDAGICDQPVPAAGHGPCRTLARGITAVLPGGQVILSNPGFLNFDKVVVDRAVSITSDGGIETVLRTPFSDSGAALTINAGVGEIVRLRGLTIDGQGTGGTGVLIHQASAVHIQNCVIGNFEGTFPWGIVDASSSNSQLFVSDTLIYNNGSTPGTGGLLIQPVGGSVRATLDRLHLENNVVGLWVDGRLTTGNGSRVLLRDSVVTGNASDGINAVSAAGKAPAFLLVEHTTVLHNIGIGIHADGPRATILLKDNTITLNGTRISATNRGPPISYGTT